MACHKTFCHLIYHALAEINALGGYKWYYKWLFFFQDGGVGLSCVAVSADVKLHSRFSPSALWLRSPPTPISWPSYFGMWLFIHRNTLSKLSSCFMFCFKKKEMCVSSEHRCLRKWRYPSWVLVKEGHFRLVECKGFSIYDGWLCQKTTV